MKGSKRRGLPGEKAGKDGHRDRRGGEESGFIARGKVPPTTKMQGRKKFKTTDPKT